MKERDSLLDLALWRLDLLPALQRLDHLLGQAMATVEIAYGPEAATDCYRGFYVSQNGSLTTSRGRDTERFDNILGVGHVHRLARD